MYCRYCGEHLSDDVLFCKSCGKPVRNENFVEKSDCEEMKIEGSENNQTFLERIRDSVSLFFTIITPLILIAFLFGFLDKPISNFVKSIFGG